MAAKGKQENVGSDEEEETVQTIPQRNISGIRNKILRNEAYKKLKKEKAKVRNRITRVKTVFSTDILITVGI